MKVILCENVPNLGELGETVTVKDGHARNFLIPRKLAVRADSGNAKELEHHMRIIRRKEEKLRVELQDVAKKVGRLKLEFWMKASDNERLFGSVTSQHIAQKLTESGYEVDRRNIQLSDPIKALGTHTIPIKLGSGVVAEVKVRVRREEEPAAEGTAESGAEPEEPHATEAKAAEGVAAGVTKDIPEEDLAALEAASEGQGPSNDTEPEAEPEADSTTN